MMPDTSTDAARKSSNPIYDGGWGSFASIPPFLNLRSFTMDEKFTDRQKVQLWLDSIGETDPACRNEVLEACAKSKECRAYYVGRFSEVTVKTAAQAWGGSND